MKPPDEDWFGLGCAFYLAATVALIIGIVLQGQVRKQQSQIEQIKQRIEAIEAALTKEPQ